MDTDNDWHWMRLIHPLISGMAFVYHDYLFDDPEFEQTCQDVEGMVHQHEIFDHMAKLEKVEVYGNIFVVDGLVEQYKRYFVVVVVVVDGGGDDGQTEQRDMDGNEW